MSKKGPRDEVKYVRRKIVDELAARVRREVRARLGPDSTFEERRDKAFEIMKTTSLGTDLAGSWPQRCSPTQIW